MYVTFTHALNTEYIATTFVLDKQLCVRIINKGNINFLKFIYLFIFGCVGSLFLCEGFLQLRRAGATLLRGARAYHCCGLSRCGAQAPDAQAQYLWLTGLVAPRHVGSSQTRARTRVPCIGRRQFLTTVPPGKPRKY